MTACNLSARILVMTLSEMFIREGAKIIYCLWTVLFRNQGDIRSVDAFKINLTQEEL